MRYLTYAREPTTRELLQLPAAERAKLEDAVALWADAGAADAGAGEPRLSPAPERA